jgi:predicted  nucleic acid-binding Zn-ribbon protein
MQTQPKIDDAAKQVKALLTEDQAKALEKRITELQEEMRNLMGGAGFGGGRGRCAGGGGGGQ